MKTHFALLAVFGTLEMLVHCVRTACICGKRHLSKLGGGGGWGGSHTRTGPSRPPPPWPRSCAALRQSWAHPKPPNTSVQRGKAARGSEIFCDISNLYFNAPMNNEIRHPKCNYAMAYRMYTCSSGTQLATNTIIILFLSGGFLLWPHRLRYMRPKSIG